jgi:hypothetical protein
VNEEDLRERLAEYRAPDEREAKQRAWRVVEAGLAERIAAGRPPRRRRRRFVLAGVAAAVVAVGALSPPGAAVAEWIRDAVRPGDENARPALTRLPAEGRLLVNSDSGPWVVGRDGSMRRLGDYTQARWSPRGLFVIATRGRQLVALDPVGEVRWSLARARAVSRPAWSPDGFRVAYLGGRSLRVVNGDGSGDVLLARTVASIEPSWRPRQGEAHELAFTDPEGRVTVTDTDSGRTLWRSPVGPIPIQLSWTPDGRRLVALYPTALRVFESDGTLLARAEMPAGSDAQAMAISPAGSVVAVIRALGAGRSEVVSLALNDPGEAGARTFAGDGRFTDLAWSPDGRWLLVAWRDADQWLFIRSARARKVEAVSNITRQFDPGGTGRGAFPALGGWCCVR